MPGNWYPALPHAHLAAGIKRKLNAKGFGVPVMSVGKIADPIEAERLLQDGDADLIGMARQLLADPDWTKKLMEGRQDDILHCIYCNVCKQLDEKFRKVTCYLWPKAHLQAPADDRSGDRPRWPDGGAGIAARVGDGRIGLTWSPAEGDTIVGYDVYRAEDDGNITCIEAVKSNKYTDRLVLGGLSYLYYVRAFDRLGRASPPSDTVGMEMPLPEEAYAEQTSRQHV